MPIILFWGDGQRLLIGVVSSLLISHAAMAESDRFSISADWGQSSAGQMSGVWNLGGVIRPAPGNRPSDSQISASLIQAKEDGFIEWELTQTDPLQNLQVLGRMSIGPLEGFVMLNDAETFNIRDTRLAWRMGQAHVLTAHTRVHGSVGVSGHLLHASYSGDDSAMGYALGFAPQLKAAMETRWSHQIRTTMSVQIHRSLLLRHFKMLGHRVGLQIHLPLMKNTDLSFGMFRKTHRYNYERVNKRIEFVTETSGLSVALEKVF